MHRPLIETASCCSITGTDWSHNTTLLKLHSSLSFLIRNRAAFDPSFFFLCTGLTSASPPPIFWPALLYLIHRPFEVFTANHSVLLPAYPMRYTVPGGSLLCSCSGSMYVRWENWKPSFYLIIFFITQSSVYAHLGSIAPVDPSLSLSPFHTSYISHIEEAGEHGSDSNTGL